MGHGALPFMAGIHQHDPQVGYDSPCTAAERIARAYATFIVDISDDVFRSRRACKLLVVCWCSFGCKTAVN
jgi:hypothetical protein